MGTSNPFGGQNPNSPLIPSWYDDGPPPSPPVDDVFPPGTTPPVANPSDPADPNQPPQAPADRTPMPNASSDRFRSARGSFTRFSKNTRNGSALHNALSSYVTKAAGGSRNAARRMGVSRQVGAGLLGFLRDAQTRGVQAALDRLDLGSLAGLPIQEIFAGLVDYVCPEGGTIDEGIARDAFIESIADLASEGITDLGTLTPEQVRTVFELYISHAIEARVFNDIGGNGIMLPADVRAVERMQKQLGEFIRHSVSDGLSAIGIENFTVERSFAFVEDVFDSSFRILQAYSEGEDTQ